MSGKKRIYLASPHMSGVEEQYVKEAFATNWIAPLGPHVDAFEREIEELVGVKAAAALTSGTAAIHLALKYVGVTRGDCVFCSTLTFAASCNPIVYEGAEPVFIDSEPESWNMSPAALLRAFEHYAAESRVPKAVIVVNLYGQSADLDAIKEICGRYGVPIIEDAAESLGATYKGKPSGTFGYFGVYSFNGNKIITTSGGGVLVSNDEEAIRKARFWATQARDPARHYQHSEIGYNYRMSNILAGIGRGQLRSLELRIRQKKHIQAFYREALKSIDDMEFMPVAAYGQPNYWLSVITLKEKSKVKPLDVILALERENIEARPVWKPMHLQPVFKGCTFFAHAENQPGISEQAFSQGVCLPSDTKMNEEDLGRVAGSILDLFSSR